MDSSCHFSIMFLSQSHLLLLILCADSIYLVRCHYWTHGSALNTRQGAIQNFDPPLLRNTKVTILLTLIIML